MVAGKTEMRREMYHELEKLEDPNQKVLKFIY